jgi:hypothetical protein
MKPTIVFQTTFTGRGKFDGFRGQQWYSHRAEIFKEYTVECLKNQTDKDFIWWLCFRPQEKENPVTNKIINTLDKSKLNYVITFDGQIMYDDRAEENNKTLIERTKLSLKSIPIKTDYIYEVHFDSDDMVHRKFVETIKDKPFKERGALFMRDGYVYDPAGKMAKWYNPKAQQNYVIMYPKDIYLDAEKRYEYQNGFKSHEDIPDKFNAEELPVGMYCSLIHGLNISTIWNHPFMGEEIYYQDEVEFVLKQFITF